MTLLAPNKHSLIFKMLVEDILIILPIMTDMNYTNNMEIIAKIEKRVFLRERQSSRNDRK